jgi:hypothetical protein
VHDINILLESRDFSVDPSAASRMAMVHRSFRSVGMRRGVAESFFKAHFPALGLLNVTGQICGVSG